MSANTIITKNSNNNNNNKNHHNFKAIQKQEYINQKNDKEEHKMEESVIDENNIEPPKNNASKVTNHKYHHKYHNTWYGPDDTNNSTFNNHENSNHNNNNNKNNNIFNNNTQTKWKTIYCQSTINITPFEFNDPSFGNVIILCIKNLDKPNVFKDKITAERFLHQSFSNIKLPENIKSRVTRKGVLQFLFQSPCDVQPIVEGINNKQINKTGFFAMKCKIEFAQPPPFELMLKNVPYSINAKTMRNVLLEQNKNIISATRIFKAGAIPTKLVRITVGDKTHYDTLLTQKQIALSQSYFCDIETTKQRQQKPFTYCINCWMPGHSKIICKQHKPTCRLCSKKGHTEHKCKYKNKPLHFLCVVCGGNHKALHGVHCPKVFQIKSPHLQKEDFEKRVKTYQQIQITKQQQQASIQPPREYPKEPWKPSLLPLPTASPPPPPPPTASSQSITILSKQRQQQQPTFSSKMNLLQNNNNLSLNETHPLQIKENAPERNYDPLTQRIIRQQQETIQSLQQTITVFQIQMNTLIKILEIQGQQNPQIGTAIKEMKIQMQQQKQDEFQPTHNNKKKRSRISEDKVNNNSNNKTIKNNKNKDNNNNFKLSSNLNKLPAPTINPNMSLSQTQSQPQIQSQNEMQNKNITNDKNNNNKKLQNKTIEHNNKNNTHKKNDTKPANTNNNNNNNNNEQQMLQLPNINEKIINDENNLMEQSDTEMGQNDE